MILPLPRHFWHGPVDWAMPKGVRWVVRTVPLPRQSGQVSAVVPGAQPVPLQSGQVSMRGAVTSFSQPKAASSKLMFQRGAHIVAPARGVGVAGLGAAAEDAREDVAEAAAAEDIVEAAEAPEAARAVTGVGVEGRVAELVVLLALVGIGEDLIGLVGLLEALLTGLVAGVLIGVVLLGDLAVCFFDLVLRGALRNAEHLVVITFICHRILLMKKSFLRG